MKKGKHLLNLCDIGDLFREFVWEKVRFVKVKLSLVSFII